MYVARLDWLAKNPRVTQRFAMHVGAPCREMTKTAVAKAERLSDSTVKALDTRGRPIWVGGKGRTEADFNLFFTALGAKKTARVIFDKFHIMRLLGHALDEVRRREYRRLAAKNRAFIKGQRYTLLSHREHLSLDGRRSLAKLLKPNKRLNTAYLLKESFGKLWSYQTEGGARDFFERW